jgi:hypothetical protein
MLKNDGCQIPYLCKAAKTAQADRRSRFFSGSHNSYQPTFAATHNIALAIHSMGNQIGSSSNSMGDAFQFIKSEISSHQVRRCLLRRREADCLDSNHFFLFHAYACTKGAHSVPALSCCRLLLTLILYRHFLVVVCC